MSPSRVHSTWSVSHEAPGSLQERSAPVPGAGRGSTGQLWLAAM